MSSATATVEVLTAEVRVLMVGSRQVTLSVYRQLDCVDWWKLEPFGRVNDGKDPLGIAVVGKGEQGELTRALLDDDEGESYSWTKHEIKLGNRRPPLDSKGWIYWSEIRQRHEFEGDISHDARVECAEDWQALPLIVLAGLR